MMRRPSNARIIEIKPHHLKRIASAVEMFGLLDGWELQPLTRPRHGADTYVLADTTSSR
jgi:hypothetical protein